jgi:hypothetical protein
MACTDLGALPLSSYNTRKAKAREPTYRYVPLYLASSSRKPRASRFRADQQDQTLAFPRGTTNHFYK